MAGGKLRDIVGGSALIDQIACASGNDIYDEICQEFSIPNDNILRRAAAAVVVQFHSKDDEKAFQNVWRLKIS